MQKYNEAKRTETLIKALEKGQDIAVVSDAGTPNICDPGAHLVKTVHHHGFLVIPIPGPCALTTHLSVSGIVSNQFHFVGFFPKKESEKCSLLKKLHHLETPIICYETSKRLIKTLQWLEACPYHINEISLGKELTKRHENIVTGTLSSVLNWTKTHLIKGEWSLIFTLTPQPIDTQSLIDDLIKCKLSNRDILYLTKTYFSIPKNTVYDYLIKHND